VGLLLAGVHGLISVVWFAVLIALAGVLAHRLCSPGTVRAIDGVTGTTLVGFSMKPAFSFR
jgi:threonine/homoserine/homoserine lactone efflux protein